MTDYISIARIISGRLLALQALQADKKLINHSFDEFSSYGLLNTYQCIELLGIEEKIWSALVRWNRVNRKLWWGFEPEEILKLKHSGVIEKTVKDLKDFNKLNREIRKLKKNKNIVRRMLLPISFTIKDVKKFEIVLEFGIFKRIFYDKEKVMSSEILWTKNRCYKHFLQKNKVDAVLNKKIVPIVLKRKTEYVDVVALYKEMEKS